MPLLTRGNLLKLLLRNPANEAIQPGEDLGHILPIEDLALRLPDQRLDAGQGVAVEVLAQPLVDLVQHLAQEARVVALLARKDLVHVARRDELVGGDWGHSESVYRHERDVLKASFPKLSHPQKKSRALLCSGDCENRKKTTNGSLTAFAHDQGLVRLANAQALDEGVGGAALGHEPQRREGGQQEGVRGRVDEVGEGGQGRRQPDRGPVQRRDQDLGVAVEGLCYVQVVGHEAAQPLLVQVCPWREVAAYGDIGTAVIGGGVFVSE